MSNRMQDGDTFLGVGWTFPPTFGNGGENLAMVSGVEDIHRSLRILFGTTPGERVLEPTFGCDLQSLAFEQLDQELAHTVEQRVKDAILRHEHRVAVDRVQVTLSDSDAGTIIVSVHYTVKRTNSRFNMVFPYSITEAQPRLGA